MILFDPPNDAQLGDLKAKHGDALVYVEDGERTFILAKPERPRGHLERMTTLSGNEKKRLEAAEGLVKTCCVWPDKDTLKSVLEDEPGMALSLAEHATELLGVRQLSVKK